jgi:hypothetical protein
MRSMLWMALTGVLLAAAPVAAQGGPPIKGGKAEKSEIPEGHKPPAGLCRIWLSGVPAGQQPAPTDCASAVRNRPGNGRVIFGEEIDKSKVPARGYRPSEPARSRSVEETPARSRSGDQPRPKGSKKPDPLG